MAHLRGSDILSDPHLNLPLSLVRTGMALALLALLFILPARTAIADDDTADDGTAATDTTGINIAAPDTTAAMFSSTGDTLVVRATSVTDAAFPTATGLVSRTELEESTGGADLAELLARVAGVQMRRYGGLGAPSVPAIRGSSPAQVAILVDGLPLENAQTGAVDLSLLPVERFGAADIYRGLVPAEFGGLGGAGAINLLTRSAPPRGIDLRVFTGSFDDLGGRLAVGARAADGSRSAQAMIHGRRIDNRYWYTDHNQTIHNPDDDVRRQRENAQFEEWGSFLSGDAAVGAVQVQANAGFFRRDGGRPGPMEMPSPHASVRYERSDARLQVAGWEGKLALDVAGNRLDQFLYDPEGEVGFGPRGTTRGLSRDLYGRLVAGPEFHFGSEDGGETATSLRLRFGGDLRRQRYRSWKLDNPRIPDEEEPERRRDTISAFADLVIDLYAARTMIVPSVRWQRSEDEFPQAPLFPWFDWKEAEIQVRENTSPSVAVITELVPEELFIEGRLVRTVRQPTWIELFGLQGGIAGNDKLRPENISSWDLATRLRLGGGKVQLRLAAFGLFTDDAIIFIQNSARTSTAINAGRTSNTGFELEALGSITRNGSWSFNLVQQKPRDRGDDPAYNGKRLPFIPDLVVQGFLAWRLGGWQPLVRVLHQGDNYRDRYNQPSELAPARTILNLQLSWTSPGQGRRITVTGEVINATDNQVYDVEGFPLPGRSYRLALHWR